MPPFDIENETKNPIPFEQGCTVFPYSEQAHAVLSRIHATNHSQIVAHN